MNLINSGVLSLLIGVPFVILLLVLLGVSIVKRRRDANWAKAAELDIANTDEEKAALEEYDLEAELDEVAEIKEMMEDEEFFQETRVESRLETSITDFSVESLGNTIFSLRTYPTEQDQRRLLAVLKRKNPHVYGFSRIGNTGIKPTFRQVGWKIIPPKGLDLSPWKAGASDEFPEANLQPEVQALVDYLKSQGDNLKPFPYDTLTIDELSVLYPVLIQILGNGHYHVRLCKQSIEDRISLLKAQAELEDSLGSVAAITKDKKLKKASTRLRKHLKKSTKAPTRRK